MTGITGSYGEYMQSAPGALPLETAQKLYDRMAAGCDREDEDIAGIWRQMQERAVAYAGIRGGWFLQSREERRKKDPARTIAHDAFISSIETIAALEKRQGEDIGWWEELRAAGSGTERKRIGDFACYIALFLGLDAR